MEIKKKIVWGDEDEEYSCYKFLVIPGCCEESITARSPFMQLNFVGAEDIAEYDLNKAVPEWCVPGLDYELIRSLADPHDHYSEIYSKTRIPLKFCPYCGKKLPEIKRKEIPPEEPVYTDADGYCGTCKERNMSCSCLPMEALFEVVEEDR